MLRLVVICAIGSLLAVGSIAAADLEEGGSLVRGVANPILRNGPEAYDAIKAGPSSAIKVGPNDYRMWYEAIADTGGLKTGAAYATSLDGTTWTKYGGNPVLVGTEGWENDEISPVSVLYDPDAKLWKMWYHGGHNVGPRAIGYAWSVDGITWTKYEGNPVLERGSSGSWEETFIADAKIIRVAADDYRMWYRGQNGAGAASYGYATSPDGITWAKYAGNPIFSPSASGWDSTALMAFAPIRESDGTYRAWYIARSADWVSAIGYATSVDGSTWERGIAPVLSAVGGDLPTDSIDAYRDGSQIRIIYGQFDLDATLKLRGKGEARAIALPPHGPPPPPPHP